MRILLMNDDGIDAPGLIALEKEFKNTEHEVFVVAPLHERSACSHSITLRDPIRVYNKGKNRFAITGNPADCAILAFEELVGKDIELVISGINKGQNMGEDIFYSGTVAAALEAMVFGFPSIAVSVTSYFNPKFETAGKFIKYLIDKGIKSSIEKGTILNINVPNLSYEELKGYRITKPGHRRYHDFVTEQKDHLDNTIFWIGGKKAVWDNSPETDSKAIADGFVSLSPIKPSFTDKERMDSLSEWCSQNNLEV